MALGLGPLGCDGNAFSTHCLLEPLLQTSETTTKGNGPRGKIRRELNRMIKRITLLVVGNARAE